MSPEQAEGKPLDARSDVFSFGAVLYEMLSGTRAFAGDTAAQVFTAVLRDHPRGLDGPPLERIVHRCCLAKCPPIAFERSTDVRAGARRLIG